MLLLSCATGQKEATSFVDAFYSDKAAEDVRAALLSNAELRGLSVVNQRRIRRYAVDITDVPKHLVLQNEDDLRQLSAVVNEEGEVTATLNMAGQLLTPA